MYYVLTATFLTTHFAHRSVSAVTESMVLYSYINIKKATTAIISFSHVNVNLLTRRLTARLLPAKASSKQSTEVGRTKKTLSQELPPAGKELCFPARTTRIHGDGFFALAATVMLPQNSRHPRAHNPVSTIIICCRLIEL